VPAEEINHLLAEYPDIIGLAFPGMPMGSPGVEDAAAQSYGIATFDAQSNQEIYACHPQCRGMNSFTCDKCHK
jgi:hypothetical protein